MRRLNLLTFVALCSLPMLGAQENNVWYSLIGSAFTDNQSYPLLQKICDEAGGRLTGSPMNEKAMHILQNELGRIGYAARLEKFKVAGWLRGDDEVAMCSPVSRKLKIQALGYTHEHPTFTAPLTWLEYGVEESYSKVDVKDKVVLITQQRHPIQGQLIYFEALHVAASHGAKAAIFMTERPGHFVVARTGNFQGMPNPVPGYVVTFEEGKWMERLLRSSVEVQVSISTKSRCQELDTANLVATLPGKTDKKLVVGAHFDSWDAGQGAIDNGIGSAVLFEVARLLKTFSPQNHLTVEFVWFNGEEQSLWGSKQYVTTHADADIAAMINLDMTGSPTGFNVMGSETLMPFCSELVKKCNGLELKDGVMSIPWLGSDHVPFLLQGIPAITPTAYLEEERVKYYHDMGDTFDKVSKKYLSEAAAVVSILTRELANSPALPLRRNNAEETQALFKKFKLDERLKRLKEWPFAEATSPATVK